MSSTAGAPGPDPSMEDILASIRRILNEDETANAAGALQAPAARSVQPLSIYPAQPAPPPVPPQPSPAPSTAPPEQVLTLDATMMVRPPASPPSSLASLGAMMPAASLPQAAPPAHLPGPPAAPVFTMHPSSEVASVSQSASSHSSLVAPEAAAAASASIGQLMRTLSEAQAQNAPSPPVEGMTQIYRGGPTLEDLVRDEMRVLLKSWLDAHLPVMVESLVRAEIARVVSRSVG